jgi:two-component system, OmpR family, response regulator
VDGTGTLLSNGANDATPRSHRGFGLARWAHVLLADPELAADASAVAALELAHHEVRVCAGGLYSVPQAVAEYRPDLVILGLPVGDPSCIADAVRRTLTSCRPLLLCTLEDGPRQRALALEAGADACLDKPCSLEEIELQARVLLRRAPWLDRTLRQIGPLVIDEVAHVVLVAGRAVDLSAKEFGLLAKLTRHAGAVLSKRALLEALWGFDAYDENLVEVHMSALRRRLPPDASRMIQTVRGVGYVLRDDVPERQLA